MKDKTNDQPRCKDCRFFKERKNPPSDIWGECHRRAPLAMLHGQFPAVEHKDWCGEWEGK